MSSCRGLFSYSSTGHRRGFHVLFVLLDKALRRPPSIQLSLRETAAC